MAAKDLSEALVKAHIVLFTFIAVSTEFLSLIHRISFPALLTAWLLFLLLCLVAMLGYRSEPAVSLLVLPRLTVPTLMLGGALAFILATTFAGSDPLSAQHLGLHDLSHVASCPLDQQQRHIFLSNRDCAAKLSDASC